MKKLIGTVFFNLFFLPLLIGQKYLYSKNLIHFKRSKEKFEGTGLGLTLCKKIVERHGGTITAIGKKDEGAEFTILLPLKQALNHI